MQEKSKLEKKLLPAVVLITTVGIIIRLLLFNFETSDYSFYLTNWLKTISEESGFARFGVDVGNYTCPYLYILAIISFIPFNKLYLIKTVSCIFDFLLSIFASKITYEITRDSKKSALAYILIFLCPTVVINSAMWAQCDSIYVSLILGSLYYILKSSPCKSMMLFGLSFAIKLQSIFFAPIFLYLFLAKKIKIRHMFLIPIMYGVTCIPAVLAGRNPLSTLTTYMTQGSDHKFLSANAPSLLGFTVDTGIDDSTLFTLSAVLLAGTAVIALLIFTYIKNKSGNSDIVFDLACVLVIMIPFLLPRMHERYFYMADSITIIYALKYGKKFWIPVLTVVSSLYCYFRYLLQPDFDYPVFIPSITMGAAFIAVLIIYICKLIKEEHPQTI